jgi:hyperosmotically inducible protein
MKIRHDVALSLVLAVLVVASAAPAQTRADEETTDAIRNELLRLPYYGVFDFLAFSYQKGTVNLMGFVYRTTLKNDAERAVKRVSRVDQVNNKIEELPVSPNDDELRWKTYYAIYRDPFLSRYAPGGGMLWGHRHPRPRSAFGAFASPEFPGTEPAGDYPIRIIVKNGHITLMGVVDSESDKNVAGIKARGVSGAFGVENELVVERPGK